MVLDKINGPSDLSKLSIDELLLLANEIREVINNRVDTIGGHLGSNLGVVELTIALDYVFDTSKDKLVFDVSHQVYTHKILTGRKDGFLETSKMNKYSGFSAPKESPYDSFEIGHTSTSISLGVGLCYGRDILNKDYQVISVIGDGSLSGGLAFEGLNNAATLNSGYIIVLNDNEMSIANNYGGLYKSLKDLRESKGSSSNNIFKSLGFDYIYLEEGNDLNKLIELFEKIKNINHPIIVHIHTNKGLGSTFASLNKEAGHYMMPKGYEPSLLANSKSVLREYITSQLMEDKQVVAVTAATPGAVGFTQDFRFRLGKYYVDTAIAEEHALSFISSLASTGVKPIFAVNSAFLQRAYDQIIHDLALNNTPATVVVFNSCLSGADATHVGAFDIVYLSNIPNINYLAPVGKEEYLDMLYYATNISETPTFIRAENSFSENAEYEKIDYSIKNKFQVTKNGTDIALIGVGSFYKLAKKVYLELLNNCFNPTLINPHFISGLDEELLLKLSLTHKVVVSFEDGFIEGGFGQKIAAFFSAKETKVLNYGAKKEFLDRTPLDNIYSENRLNVKDILEDINNIIKD